MFTYKKGTMVLVETLTGETFVGLFESHEISEEGSVIKLGKPNGYCLKSVQINTKIIAYMGEYDLEMTA